MMSYLQEEAMFNIGAVARMTGILEATLRVWERRYDFPKSARTSGGHRLYSQQDVSRLQWVKTRIDEGMQVSHAIRALLHAETEGTFVPISSAPPVSGLRVIEEGSSTSAFHEQLLDALVKHNIDGANHIIGEAQILYPLERIILEIIGPTLYAIGKAWEQNKIDVATEHLATNHLRHYLLMWMRTGPPPYAINPALLACAPGELHEGSLLMLAVLLRRLRWPVLYLGQTMPLDSLSIFIEDLVPSVVVFVAMTEEPARALLDWPTWLPTVARDQRPMICFGGLAFNENVELAAQVQGIFLGRTLQEGTQKLDAILHQLNPLLQ
jgi:DNA-binding transcriptional MerR regulator